MGLAEDSFHMGFGGKDEGEDIRQLSAGDTIILTKAKKYAARAALHALGETDITAERLEEVDDPEVACLLLQAEVATVIPNKFLSGSSLTRLDLSSVSCVKEVDDAFLYGCTTLTSIEGYATCATAHTATKTTPASPWHIPGNVTGPPVAAKRCSLDATLDWAEDEWASSDDGTLWTPETEEALSTQKPKAATWKKKNKKKKQTTTAQHRKGTPTTDTAATTREMLAPYPGAGGAGGTKRAPAEDGEGDADILLASTWLQRRPRVVYACRPDRQTGSRRSCSGSGRRALRARTPAGTVHDALPLRTALPALP